MSPSRTLCIGMDGHQATMAVAYIVQEPGAAGTSLGTMGARQGDLDPLVCKIYSQATHLIFVFVAGPCGS
jgi:hypothetical protein